MTTVAKVPYVSTSLTEPNSAADIVDRQISTLQSRAETMLASARAAITGLGAIRPTISPSSVSLGTVSGLDAIEPFTEDVDLDPQYEDIPTFEETPSFQNVTVSAKEIQPFGDTPPPVTPPAKTFEKPTGRPVLDRSLLKPVNIPSDPPGIDTAQILAKIKEMIDTPGITEELPSYSPVNFADISTGLDPGNALDAYRERLFSFSEPLSDTALTEHLLADIILSLQSGGRGLPEDAENALFLRAKDRLADEYEDTFNKEDARLAAQGWIIPTGAHVAALADITARRNRALEQASHEAMIENARLILQDRNNAREIAVKFEGVYREYLSGYYARALEAEKEVAAESLKVLQIAIEQQKLLADNARLRVEMFDAFLKSSMMELEAFEKKLAMKKVMADIRGQDVQMLMAWTQAALAEVQIFEARVKGAVAVSDYNQSIVGAFGEEVKAYAADLGAFGEEVRAWATETDAAYRVLDGFKAHVEAYKAHAEAVESQNRVQTSIAEIGIKKNEANLMAFRGMVDAFAARLQAIGEKNRTEGTRIGAEAQVFGAKAAAHAEIQSAMASAQKSRVDAETNRLALAIEQNRVNITKATSELELTVEALKSVAQYTSTLSAGLYAAINVGATVSNGLSVSRSVDHSYRSSLSNTLGESLGGGDSSSSTTQSDG